MKQLTVEKCKVREAKHGRKETTPPLVSENDHNIANLQGVDPKVQAICRCLDDENFEILEEHHKWILENAPWLQNIDGVVYYQTSNMIAGEPQWHIYVPEVEQTQILIKMHDKQCHQGIQKTFMAASML